MIEPPHDVTAQAVVEFTRNLFKTLARKYGSDCTLNELRIMNQIIRCSLMGRTCSVTALHKVTGISIPSVSRAVTKFQKSGWLSDEPDPADGRKRIISLGPRSLKETRDDIDKSICWINNFRDNGLDS